jgi:signal transduction histidine kinase
MASLKQSLRRIPVWAYLFVVFTIYINTSYLIIRYHYPLGGATAKVENGYVIHDYVNPGGTVYKAGIRSGDTLLTLNSIPVEKWNFSPDVGDTIIVEILKNSRVVTLPVVVGSIHSFASGFFWSMYIIVVLVTMASLYLLYKKPADRSLRLFFICIQLFMIMANGLLLRINFPLTMIASSVFILTNYMLGPCLISFHLIFPKPVKRYNLWKRLPFLLFIVGGLMFAGTFIVFWNILIKENLQGTLLPIFDRATVIWLTLNFFIALLIVVFQYRTIRDTLARNQLRLLFSGTFFGLITPVTISIFYPDFISLMDKHPAFGPVSQGAGTLILIACILVAVLRFRIWDIEVIIRKALLYLGATAVIILSYLFVVWLVDQFTAGTTDLIRFAILAFSVILFLVIRDRLQRLIDRMFHRETYDSATVVSEFEAKLAGIYRMVELKEKIVQGLDEIFHFKSFILGLKKEQFIYQADVVNGIMADALPPGFEITPEMDEKLRKAKVFSPEELAVKPPFVESANSDLIVPLLSGGQPEGFFLCGQKKSERIYSRQDINVLSLLAQRVVSLLHTAGPYQKDLDRQLMLEKERARIARDMHDDIGAGLTKIAMISEAPAKMQDAGYRMQDTDNSQCHDLISRLGRIASYSRDMISRLNVIVWALNPKYDNLESLISYLRRYFGEYLENFNIRFLTDFPEEIPDISITPDTRRNIFYAVQEAIHNAVKHSGCSEIGLCIQPHPLLPLSSGRGGRGERSLTITISDNGKGFDTVKPGSGGNGLLNMKKRAEEMGGTFEIQSSPGHGTMVLFSIRL